MNPPAPSFAGDQLVVFRLDGQRYAVPLERVERVIRMVALAAFPRAPEIVSGVFDLHGELIPVVDVRRRFRRPERPPRSGDQLMVVRTTARPLALTVDTVEGVLAAEPAEVVDPAAVVPGLEYVRGIVQRPDGIIFVHDLDAFLSLEEEARLVAALNASRA